MKQVHFNKRTEIQAPARLSRRTFFRQSAAGIAAASLGAHLEVVGAESPSPSGQFPPRKMKICLSPRLVGLNVKIADLIPLAAQYGFEGIDPMIEELATLSESAVDQLRETIKKQGLVVGPANIALPIGKSQEEFAAWLGDLPGLAAVLQRVGCNRIVNFVKACDANLTYLENFRVHTRRLREIASVLDDHGFYLGLEYIGPKINWTRQRYPFIHTLKEFKELLTETDKNNIGFLLDSWHWYCAGETAADILSLRKEQIVCVHLNDAPAGIPVDQQIDSKRALPASTGIIDISGFLGAVLQLGYAGPVVVEPCDAELNKLPTDQKLQKVIDSVGKAFNAAGSPVKGSPAQRAAN